MQGNFVAYFRVSTDRQGQSGLGLDAQRAAVANYLNGGGWEILGQYIEVESGKRSDRPELAKALAHCRLTGATLVVAKLDRLARNAAFLMSVYDGSGEGGVVFCDLPSIPAGPTGRFIIQQMAAVAELEGGLISQRTKAALQAAKARGQRLGGFRGYVPDHGQAVAARQRAAQARAAELAPMLRSMLVRRLSLRAMAGELTRAGIRTPRGGRWTAAAVQAVFRRLPPLSADAAVQIGKGAAPA